MYTNDPLLLHYAGLNKLRLAHPLSRPAGYWPTDSALRNDPIIANKMNSIPKIVFSNTLLKADWNNTKLVKDISENEVKRQKLQYDNDIFIIGSAILRMNEVVNMPDH